MNAVTQEAVPFAPPTSPETEILWEEEKYAVGRVLDSGWLSRGPECRAFEEEFAASVGAGHAVSLSSCTAALHLALAAYGIGPGDEVIVPSMTFVATVNAVLYQRAQPVLADVDEDYCLNPEQILRWVTPRTKAVIGVDMHGLACFQPELPERVRWITDAAHSLGAWYDPKRRIKVGAAADATCFSFYATKQMTTGDGGMLTTGDPELAERVRCLSLHGMGSQAWRRYAAPDPDNRMAADPDRPAPPPGDIPLLGYKYNMTDLQAAIGRVQLGRLEQFLYLRNRLAQRYHQLLTGLFRSGKLILPPAKTCWHLYAIRVPERDRVMAALKARGIGTGVHFHPVHQASYFRAAAGSHPSFDELPVTEQLGAETLSLPLFAHMTFAQQDRVAQALTEVLDG
jgi:dTDP-4-amino-4,6-dideoxygalactose transaminase